jgi:hypothetical protein
VTVRQGRGGGRYPEDFNPRGLGTECRDYFSQIVLSDNEKAFLLVVTQTPGYHVQAVADGIPIEVSLEPALGDREVGILDLTGIPAPESTQIAVTDDSGNTIPCIQE